MNINRVTLSGHLTRDPEVRATANGLAVMGFSIAVNDRKKNQQTGEWEDVASFFDCTMFGNRAESLSKYLDKGSKVAIEGKLRQQRWEKDGQKHSKVEVLVDQLEFMTAQKGSSGDEVVITDPEIKAGLYEEDIPF